jgi:hypothetical protein
MPIHEIHDHSHDSLSYSPLRHRLGFRHRIRPRGVPPAQDFRPPHGLAAGQADPPLGLGEPRRSRDRTIGRGEAIRCGQRQGRMEIVLHDRLWMRRPRAGQLMELAYCRPGCRSIPPPPAAPSRPTASPNMGTSQRRRPLAPLPAHLRSCRRTFRGTRGWWPA